MKILTKIAVIVIACCSIASAKAAPTVVRAAVDSTTIMQGNKTKLRVTVVKDNAQSGRLIVPADSLVNDIDIVGERKVTKADVGNGRTQETYEIPIQPFSPGVFVLPGLKYVVGNDTVTGNTVSIKVLEADVSKMQDLYEYKTVAQPDKKFWDFLPDMEQLKWLWWVLGAIVVLALIAVGVIMYQRWKAGKPILPFIAQKPLLPPYEEAQEAFDALRKTNPLAQGDAKGYYSRLTDIVRRYIWRQYGIGAMEMTSSQIMDAVESNGELKDADHLQYLLETADFVKFAKMGTSTDENERSMQSAVTFVESNKPAEPTEEELKNKKSKKLKDQ